jgi:hypothetical protein
MDVEKFKAFKEAVKEGCSIRKALEKSGMSRGAYDYYYNQIWSDPEMAPYKPKSKRKVEKLKPPEQKPPDERAESPVIESERRLREYLGGETEFEREWNSLKLKEAQLLKAAMKIVGMSVPPSSAPTATTPAPEKEEKATAFEDFEERRQKMRDLLEKMGFKVEDQYLRRDEVERIVEEAKRRAAEEALDDKRIEAVRDIIQDAVARIIEMFKPAINMIFVPPPKKEAPPERATEQGTGSSTSHAS